MEDLSSLAKDSMWATSQEGGNRASARPHAMTAPGSPTAVPVPQSQDTIVPEVHFSGPEIKPGDNGRPTPKTAMPASRPAWVKAG